jgi:transmembrane sensor
MEDKNNKYRKQENDSEKKMDHFLSSLSVPSGKSKEEAWNDFLSKVNSSDNTAVNNQNNSRKSSAIVYFFTQPLSIAASLLIIAALGISIIWLAGVKTVTVPRGETLAITLPDKTEVFLNAESSISYKRTGWKKNRIAELQGEAFFKVSKGPGFTVVFPSGSVTVIGTSFNVFSRENNFEVLCKSGAVLVTSGENNIAENLQSGEGIRKETINDELLIKRFEFSTTAEIPWIQGDFYFDNIALESVFKEIERQFDVIIHAPDVDTNRRYSGVFRRGNLNEALEMVCIPMGLEYRLANGNEIVIF